jgi:hypothetical protein
LTGIDDPAAAPVLPASRDPASLPPRPGVTRLLLRRSATLHFVIAVAVCVATAAVHTALAPWFGAALAGGPSLVFLGIGALAFAAWSRRQAAVIEIGPDSLVAYGRDGATVAQGRLVGASQWGASLLALVVQPREGRRRTTVLVTGDALEPEAFRVLAVRARSAAGR